MSPIALQTDEAVKARETLHFTDKLVNAIVKDVALRRGERTQIIGALTASEWKNLSGSLRNALATNDVWEAGRQFRGDLGGIGLNDREQVQACNIVASALLSLVPGAHAQSWRMAAGTIAS